MSSPGCLTCTFWKPIESGEWGMCRRHAPVVVGPAAQLAEAIGGMPAEPQTVFPMVSRSEWCGEWEKRA